MKYTNKLNLPEAFCRAVQTERHCAPGTLSATTLLKGTKETVLLDRHFDEIETDVSDDVWKIFGTAVHSIMEKATGDDISEERLWVDIDGIRVTGQMDLYDMSSTVTDWKTASVWKVMYKDFDDWRRQGLIYAWLLRKNGFPCDRAQFIAFLKDWSKTKAARETDYPQSPVYKVVFEYSGKDFLEIEKFIKDRISDYKKAIKKTDDDIVPCSKKERWASDDTWAVMKKGRKSAVKVCASETQAQDMVDRGAGDNVEYRPGESKKCAGYCLARDFCNFWRENGKH